MMVRKKRLEFRIQTFRCLPFEGGHVLPHQEAAVRSVDAALDYTTLSYGSSRSNDPQSFRPSGAFVDLRCFRPKAPENKDSCGHDRNADAQKSGSD